MATRVYSELLFEVNSGVPTVTPIAGPGSGLIWVIRDIEYSALPATFGAALIGFALTTGTGGIVSSGGWPEMVQGISWHRELRSVIRSSDSLTLQTYDPNNGLRACGYVLTLP